MRFKEFTEISRSILEKHFNLFSRSIAKGLYQFKDGIFLFPNIILFTETDDHFIFELFGSDTKFKGLRTKNHKISSTISYLYQFETTQEGPTFHLNTKGVKFRNLWFSREADLEYLRKRFIIQDENYPSSKFIFEGGNGAVFSFGDQFESCFMKNCFIVNRFQEIFRVKYILQMAIINKNRTQKDYLNELEEMIIDPLNDLLITCNGISNNLLFGIHYCQDKFAEEYILSSQFANIFLIPGLHETVIGDFLKTNPAFIKKALSFKDCMYGPEFQWIEGNPNKNEKSIIPDLMFERFDGRFDIGDLKTALLDKNQITKGGHKRRRFIDYVEEGIAQLANYEEYFKFEKNNEFARIHHNVMVTDPNLFLIVGNYENAKKEEIEEAARRLKPNFKIIDYDTLNALFLRDYKMI